MCVCVRARARAPVEEPGADQHALHPLRPARAGPHPAGDQDIAPKPITPTHLMRRFSPPLRHGPIDFGHRCVQHQSRTASRRRLSPPQRAGVVVALGATRRLQRARGGGESAARRPAPDERRRSNGLIKRTGQTKRAPAGYAQARSALGSRRRHGSRWAGLSPNRPRRGCVAARWRGGGFGLGRRRGGRWTEGTEGGKEGKVAEGEENGEREGNGEDKRGGRAESGRSEMEWSREGGER